MADKHLILVRHAKSSWTDPRLPDHDRPLNARGMRNAPLMGARAQALGILADALITSSALRARTTAEHFLDALDPTPAKLRVESDLYHADVATWLAFMESLPDTWSSVMAFGHNPGLTELAADVWDLPVNNVPTCGVLWLTFTGPTWKETTTRQPVTALFDYPKNPSNLPEVLR